MPQHFVPIALVQLSTSVTIEIACCNNNNLEYLSHYYQLSFPYS